MGTRIILLQRQNFLLARPIYPAPLLEKSGAGTNLNRLNPDPTGLRDLLYKIAKGVFVFTVREGYTAGGFEDF